MVEKIRQAIFPFQNPTFDMNPLRSCFKALLAVFFLLSLGVIKAQDTVSNPAVVTLRSQYDELQRRTRVYEGFRAIREDLFQVIKRQSLDSLQKAMQLVKLKEEQLLKLTDENKRLLANAEEANASLSKAVSEINSITFLGKPVGKTFYNLLVWTIIGLLVLINLVILLMFRNARHISRQRLDDFSDLLDEYETYRKTSRERLERTTIEHFNEIKKLKGL